MWATDQVDLGTTVVPIYLIHEIYDNVIMFDVFMWNQNKSNVCDDVIFIASCINEALNNEIQWPIVEERAQLGSQIPEFQGYIKFIDGTLIETQKH